MLFRSVDQVNGRVVRRNLLLHQQTGADLHLATNKEIWFSSGIAKALDHKQKYGVFPYVIPIGGSCPIGILGFVNAMFELKQQIESGALAQPDMIFVATADNSGGTFVGLVLGAMAAGIQSKIIPVLVEPVSDIMRFRNDIMRLFETTNTFLAERDKSFPTFSLDPMFDLIENCGGDRYALFTPEAVAAIKLVKEKANIQLDGVYTGKAFAGLMDYAKNHDLSNKTVLFWNTFCSEVPADYASADYRDLPNEFHQYFENDIQPLDR